MIPTACLRRPLRLALSPSPIYYHRYYRLPITLPGSPSESLPTTPEQTKPSTEIPKQHTGLVNQDQDQNQTGKPIQRNHLLKNIDSALDRHPDEKWGFVVYRLVYNKRTRWKKMLCSLGAAVKRNVDQRGRTDLLARHQMVVMNDRDKFRNMTLEQVHAHFTAWAKGQLRQVPERDPAAARYYACLVVDSACLMTVGHPYGRPPLVKLLLGRSKFLEPVHEPKKLQGVTDGVNWTFIRVPRYVDLHEYLRRPTTEYPQITSHVKAEAFNVKKQYFVFSVPEEPVW